MRDGLGVAMDLDALVLDVLDMWASAQLARSRKGQCAVGAASH